jgi:hypothetical protein
MFLHVVGHNQRFRVVHQSFRKSIETVHRIFHQVLYVVGELRGELIKPPSTSTHPKFLGSPRWYPFLQVLALSMLSALSNNTCICICLSILHTLVVGAIDGTHVLARVPRHIQQAFRGRKTQPTQNVMAAVDFDLKFTYVLAR